MKPEAAARKKLNNAKYCKTYREKKLSEIRKKDRERKKFDREHMRYTDKKKYEALLKKDRERKQREKERREQQEEESQSQASSSTPSSSFKHRSTKVRSLKKAENALPNSPSKRQEVITNLASKYQIRVVLQEPKKPGPKPAVLTEAEEEWLVCLTGANFVFRIIFELHKMLQ